jgi:hypothetical protein
MRFGLSPQEASRVSAEATAMAYNLGLPRQHDPLSEMEVVLNPDGMWSTQIRANTLLQQQVYSENKNRTIGLAVAGVVGVGLLFWLFRRK